MKFTKSWITDIRLLAEKAPGGAIPIANFPSKYVVKDAPRRAAVFIPLCNRHGVASVLFTVRSQTVGSHKGQVSFPGGHIDQGEGDVDAAIREMYEELGSGVGDLQILGLGQIVPARTLTPVTPVLGFMEQDVGDFEHFSPSTGEVERVFTRSLEQLLDPAYMRYEMLSRNETSPKVRMPLYGWSDENGNKDSNEYEERIWGLTAIILESMLKNIVEPTKPSS